MPKADHEPNILPSLLDRLLDDEPDVSREPASSRYANVRELKNAVARDLEAMLNTRRETLEDLSSDFTEANRSLLTYGLPDFTAFNLMSQTDRTRIRRALEQTIAAFEPRLKRVRVNLEPPRQNDRSVRFRVEALLPLDPAPEVVTFDTVLQLHTQQYVVQGKN